MIRFDLRFRSRRLKGFDMPHLLPSHCVLLGLVYCFHQKLYIERQGMLND